MQEDLSLPSQVLANGFLLRTIQTCLSLWERCHEVTERAGIGYIFSLIYSDAKLGNFFALSVICFANVSSPEKAGANGVHLAHEKGSLVEGAVKMDVFLYSAAAVICCAMSSIWSEVKLPLI